MIGVVNKKLNSEQTKAIKHGKGALLIIAGAGTGKTTVITERIKYLITKRKLNPSEILALTFTEKAAKEMQDRVDIALPYGYSQMWISTFHSFCDKVLKSELLQIGLNPKFKLMTQSEAVQLMRKYLFEFGLDYFRPLGNPNKFIEAILQHFSRLQDEDITPNDYLQWVKAESKKKSNDKLEMKKWNELARAYKKYEEIKIEKESFDYGDLIVKSLKLFRERKNVLRQYRKRFKYLLVDEFQDTNYSQNELVKLLAGKDGNITVVADDDQAVYRWRGAAISNVIQFRKSFPKTKIITLSKNYRSIQEILDKAYGLIQHNNPDRLEVVEKINKRLLSMTGKKNVDSDPSVKFIHEDRVENEADEVAKEIVNLIERKDNKLKHKDFAILVRANNHAEPFKRALSRHGIPYQFLGPGRLFKQPEIVDLISYLKILNNFEDSLAMYRILSLEYLGISARDISLLVNYAKRKNTSLFNVLENVDETFVSSESKERVVKLVAVINKHLKLIRKETAGQILYYFLEDLGILTKLLSPDNPESERRASNISKFFDKLKTYEVDHEDAGVSAVVDWIDLAMEMGESPLATNSDWSEVDAVNIMTIHSAKGLEFPVVFLVNLVAQRFPTTERSEQIPIPEPLIKEILPKGDYHLQEERRLFYVGMTRAKEKLYLTAADYYGEGKREKRLSPFVFETLGDEMEKEKEKFDNEKQLSILDYQVNKSDHPISIHNYYKINFLSYSQMETFRICPMHYKLRYIIKIPTPASASQSFGISIHSAIKSFYDLVKKSEKPTKKLLHNCLVDSWVREGYLSKKHEDKFFDKGKFYLDGFLKEGFDLKNLPEVTEFPFVIPIFTGKKKITDKPLKIGGKIDRVDVNKDGTVEIIDYKTGATIPTQKEVDKDLQLSFYALAASTLRESPFAKLPDKIKLSLYYLDTQEKLSTQRSKEELEQAKKYILKVRDEIENSDFKCSGHILCKSCEYKLFCNQD